MQYLLNEEEMADIRRDREALRLLPGRQGLVAHLDGLKAACQQVATTMTPQWSDRPHGCIHVSDEDGRRAWYCDKCPVREICPQPKEWSK